MTEYVIIVSILMVCAVVGLFRSGSSAIDSIARSKAICAECPKIELNDVELDDLERLRAKRDEAERNPTDPSKALTAEERARLEDLERRSGTTTDGSMTTDAGGNPKPASPFERWLDSVFGPGWQSDSYLGAFLGLFGWFGFFA